MNQNQNTNVNELNFERDPRNRHAGNEPGGALKDESKDPVEEPILKKPDVPLFLRDSSEGPQGNAQDEKDKTEE